MQGAGRAGEGAELCWFGWSRSQDAALFESFEPLLDGRLFLNGTDLGHFLTPIGDIDGFTATNLAHDLAESGLGFVGGVARGVHDASLTD